MSMKSRQHWPPGGWKFFEASTNWSPPQHLSFTDTANQIIAHRQANSRWGLATDRHSVEQELDAYNVKVLREQYGDAAAAQWVMFDGGGQAVPPFMPPRLHRAVGAVAVAKTGTVEKAKAGVGLLLDFLGPTLTPVAHELAEKRASVCTACPKNQPGNILIHAAGEGLKLLLEARSEMKLFTSHDANLKDCAVCQCNLHLKPHVDLAYILEKTTPEQMAAFPEICWIKRRDVASG